MAYQVINQSENLLKTFPRAFTDLRLLMTKAHELLQMMEDRISSMLGRTGHLERSLKDAQEDNSSL